MRTVWGVPGGRYADYAYRPQGRRLEALTAPDAITRYEMGEHPYNFNEEGLANYGLLPDLLQDLKNVGMNPREFEALFTSAEGFVQMWEKAVALSGGNAPFKPRPLDCDLACHNLCPESPNRGAPSPRR